MIMGPKIPKTWSNEEQWVWERVQAGEVADFNERDRETDPAFEELDPTQAEGWDVSRRLSIPFLQTILTKKPFVDATPFKGVKILGALVDGDTPLDLAHARLERLVWLEKSRLLMNMECRDLHVDGEFSLDGSYVKGTLSLPDARIHGNLSFAYGLHENDLNLTAAKIDGQLSMIGSTFAGVLAMNGIEIGQSLFMKGTKDSQATFNNVDLTTAKINGQVSIIGSTFDGKLTMNAIEVGRSLFMKDRAIFKKDVDLTTAKIGAHVNLSGSTFNGKLAMNGAKAGGQLSMIGSTFDGKLTMDGIEVGQGLYMREHSTFKKDVDLTTAKIDGQVDLSGSTLDGRLTMNGAKISGQLRMNHSTLKGTLAMNGTEVGLSLVMTEKATFKNIELNIAKIGEQISMISSTFDGKLNMNGTEVGQSLFMGSRATFKEVDLITAKIGGQINMNGSTFNGKLNMNGTEVAQNLFMNEKSTFKEVDLTGAKIDGQAELSGSTFDGKLSMSAIEVGRSLFMNKTKDSQTTFKDVDLSAAKIGDHLFMFGSRFKHKLELGGAKISGDLNMNGSTFGGEVTINSATVGKRFLACGAEFPAEQEVIFHFSSIGSSFDLSGATVGKIDLTGTTIAGEFRLGSTKDDGPTKWHKNSKLVLRNTSVDAIQDAPEESSCWPRELGLDGFTYKHLGGLGAGETADFGKRKSSWFIAWLARDPTFSPQPYEQLAKVLQEAGDPAKSADVLYAGRKRARQKAGEDGERFRWVGMLVLQLTIGYGLGWRYFFAMGWVGVFTLLGTLILIIAGQSCHTSWLPLFFASFDQLLPFITLNEAHDVLVFGDTSAKPLVAAQPYWVQVYFYFHKIVGFVLGSFIVAGLAGLTQRN